MPTDPHELAARPAFAAFLARLRGGEEKCPRLRKYGGDRCHSGCKLCHGSGRVAVPPDPEAGLALADWWQEGGVAGGHDGGDLAGMLAVYAGLTEPCPVCSRRVMPGWVGSEDRPERCPRCRGTGELPDDSLRPALVALTERDDDPRVRALAPAARGLGVKDWPTEHCWLVYHTDEKGRHVHHDARYYDDPAPALLALKRAALALYDPLVRVPCRAEGAWLTVQYVDVGPAEFPLDPELLTYDAPVSGGRNAFRLDGARVGAPPDWSWTPHALPCGRCRGSGDTRGPGKLVVRDCPGCGGTGSRLLVTWECRPSDLLPAPPPGGDFWPTDEELANTPDFPPRPD